MFSIIEPFIIIEAIKKMLPPGGNFSLALDSGLALTNIVRIICNGQLDFFGSRSTRLQVNVFRDDMDPTITEI